MTTCAEWRGRGWRIGAVRAVGRRWPPSEGVRTWTGEAAKWAALSVPDRTRSRAQWGANDSRGLTNPVGEFRLRSLVRGALWILTSRREARPVPRPAVSEEELCGPLGLRSGALRSRPRACGLRRPSGGSEPNGVRATRVARVLAAAGRSESRKVRCVGRCPDARRMTESAASVRLLRPRRMCVRKR